MSTGPGPTRKADGTADASVDDIADLLVEDDPSHPATSEEVSEDGLEVMLETPGPALANPFMPPPPSPMGDMGEENENADENGAATNLAYEDLLAKLVLPAKAPEPEPEMPALMSSLPLPEPVAAPLLLPPPSYPLPSGQSLQVAPPAEERTLVTENPLVAEEQEAAVREGRFAMRGESIPVQEDMRSVPTEPVAVAANGVAAKSRLVYLMLGGLLVLGGMILAVLVLKLLMPTPAPQSPAIVAPTPPPPSAPPAHVESACPPLSPGQPIGTTGSLTEIATGRTRAATRASSSSIASAERVMASLGRTVPESSMNCVKNGMFTDSATVTILRAVRTCLSCWTARVPAATPP